MLFGLSGLFLLSLTAEASSPGSLIERVDERARRTTSLSAEFVQSYRSAALGRELLERGTLFVKRPGRMLWEYREPEKKTFVSDGKTFYFYVPAEKQVIVRDQSGERGLAVALLSGGASLLDQFRAAPDERSGSGRLMLLPKKPDPELERAYLDLDAEARIVGIEVWDAQGNRSRFRFERLRENVPLDDRLFRFQIPRGVTVIAG